MIKKVILQRGKIAYIREGVVGKPKILMLHGLFTNSEYFRETMELLKDDFDMIAPDFPGFGLSERLKNREHTLDSYSDLIKELIDYLDFHPFYLIGTSLGGMVSLKFIYKYPLYVSKIFLQASPWNQKCISLKLHEKAVAMASLSKNAVKIAYELKKGINNSLLHNTLSLFNKHYLKIDNRNKVISYSFKTLDVQATSQIWNNLYFSHTDLSKEAKSISVPALVIVGDHDESVKPLSMRLLARMIKGSKFVEIKNIEATHALLLDFPERIAKIIKSFFLKKGI